MAESSKKKKMKRFDFVTEGGKHIHLTKEEINEQKRIEEDAKGEAAKQEGEVRRVELVYLLGVDVVDKYYNDKLQEVVKACPNITAKGWKTIYEQIQSRMDYIPTTEAEQDINLDIPLRSGVGFDTAYPRHGYTVSSLMDTAYWVSEQ
ncbi:hypothetical protein Tco_1148403 [Tanacetum coccineum]